MSDGIVIHSSAWANAGRTAVRAIITRPGGTEDETWTVSRNDPNPDAADVFARASGGEGGTPGDYTPPAAPVMPAIPPAPPPLPIPPPSPATGGPTPPVYVPPTPAMLIRQDCDTRIVAGFSSNGESRRASMNLWAAAVALEDSSQRSDDDKTCAAMTATMNDWEGSMYAERDRLIAGNLTLAAANWPALPDGAAAFMALCDQG